MNPIETIIESRLAAAAVNRERVVGMFEHEFGFRIPQAPFPATIVGLAHPMPGQREREFANSKLAASPGPCTDPDGLDLCFDESTSPPPDSDGFYADEYLPCGVAPVRYRWIAQSGGGHSNGCGFRMVGDDPIPWRQAFYAVNVSHGSADGVISPQDRRVDYGPIPNQTNPNDGQPFLPDFRGLPVIMAFGYIGHLTNQTPEWGFFFTHSTDPIGVRACQPTPTPPNPNPWCCYYIAPGPPGGTIIECVTVPGPTRPEATIQCQSYGQMSLLQGHNPGTPGQSCTC